MEVQAAANPRPPPTNEPFNPAQQTFLQSLVTSVATTFAESQSASDKRAMDALMDHKKESHQQLLEHKKESHQQLLEHKKETSQQVDLLTQLVIASDQRLDKIETIVGSHGQLLATHSTEIVSLKAAVRELQRAKGTTHQDAAAVEERISDLEKLVLDDHKRLNHIEDTNTDDDAPPTVVTRRFREEEEEEEQDHNPPTVVTRRLRNEEEEEEDEDGFENRHNAASSLLLRFELCGFAPTAGTPKRTPPKPDVSSSDDEQDAVTPERTVVTPRRGKRRRRMALSREPTHNPNLRRLGFHTVPFPIS